MQAFALALGAWPTWHLAHQAGLKENQAIVIAFVYLLYPLVFNANLFDFHPEAIAQIHTKESVYTTAQICPHLSNRKLITYCQR